MKTENIKLKPTKCSNDSCSQVFGVWDKNKKSQYFCSAICQAAVNGGVSFWGSEDRRATELKNKRAKKDSDKLQ